MKGRVDKSMGIVTLIPEVLGTIKPTDPLIFSKLARNETVQIHRVILQLEY